MTGACAYVYTCAWYWLGMQVRETLWNPMPEVKAHRLCRYTVPIDAQETYESEKWVFAICCWSAFWLIIMIDSVLCFMWWVVNSDCNLEINTFRLLSALSAVGILMFKSSISAVFSIGGWDLIAVSFQTVAYSERLHSTLGSDNGNEWEVLIGGRSAETESGTEGQDGGVAASSVWT